MSPEDQAEIIAEIRDNWIASSYLVAALMLVTYDITLTFQQEVKCIWQRRISGVTVLYVIVRYGTLVDMIVQVLDEMWTPMTIPSCKGISYSSAAADIISLLAINVFNCLRTWAICPRPWFPFAIVFILSMFPVGVNLYVFALPEKFVIVPSGIFAGCVVLNAGPEPYFYLPVITRVVAVAADLAVLVFTLLETVSLYKTSRDIHLKPGLATVLVRNGSLQFLTLLCLNAATLAFDVSSIAVENIRWSTAFIYINSSLASVLISRFILDLRSVYRSNANSDAPEHSVSSVRFASAVVANLGAPLDASWVTGRSENCDDADEEPTQFSNNPLGIGLLDLEKSENDASTPLEDANTLSPRDVSVVAAREISETHV